MVSDLGGHAVTGFVGRERELAALTAGLDDAFAGHGRLFLISGEPGIGKSRLVDELASRARERGAQVLAGRCWEAGGAPAFWPWVQALRACIRGRDPQTFASQLGAGAADVAQIVPDVHGLIPDLQEPLSTDPEGARFRLFDSVSSFLRAVAEEQVLVLLLDDLHAADEPSLLLLRFVAREIDQSRLLVIGAYRDVDPTLSHPLAAAMAELAREPVTRRLSLSGLHESDVGQFIELNTVHRPPQTLVETVHAATEGNPLFVGEIVRLLADEGRLDDAEMPQLGIPQSVKEVIGRRLRHLSDECNRVLAHASVLGREFDLDALARVSGVEPDMLLRLLEEAKEARVVSEVPGVHGRLRFAHVLIRDELYESLPPSHRAQLHREVGEALESLRADDPEPHLAELAHHFLRAEADGRSKTLDYVSRAGERAAGLLAHEEAVRFYEIALTLTDETTTRCKLLLALGEAQSRAGDTPAAKAIFREAAQLAESQGLPDQLARAALGYGGRVIWDSSRDDPYLAALLERALMALGEEDSILRVRLLARLAGGPLRDSTADADRRHALAAEALAVARRVGDPATIAHAILGYTSSHHSPDFTHHAPEHAQELTRVALQAGDLECAFEGYATSFGASIELADLPAAHAHLETMAGLADELRQPAQRWIAAVYRSFLALLEGRFDEAERLITQAHQLGERAQTWTAGATYALQLYLLRCEQGRLGEVETLVRRSSAENQTYPILRCALACMLAELGSTREADAEFEALAAEDFTGIPFDEEWAVSMCLLAETAVRLGDLPRAGTLYDRLLPYADRVTISYTEISLGPVARYLGILAEATGKHDDAERHFRHSLELSERIGARPWLAHTQHDFASFLLARGGDAGSAAELLRSALTTARQLRMEPLAANVAALLADLESGDVAEDSSFAGYRIEGEIGRGGMGVVYRATDLQLERSVALKLIAPELASEEDFRKRFLSESRLAASLDHGNVVPIYEAGEEDGRLFLAMRYVEGSDLKALLGEQGKLPAERALSILGRVADALDAAHARGLVHRDVKPGNVLLDERGHPYLTDFGLTKEAGGASTQTGHIVGTLDYLAPEQIRGEEIDGRTDEYALACLLYECLSGKPPFRRSTEAEVLWGHMQERPPALKEYPALDPVLARALAKEKADRHPSCGEFLAAAHAALGLEAPAVRRRRLYLGRRLLVAGGALVAAAGIAIAVVELTGGESSTLATPAPNSVVEIDSGRNKPVAQVAVGSNPTVVALDRGAVWALNADDQTISRIDRKTKLQKTFSVGTTPTDLAVGEGAVWIGNGIISPTSKFVGPILSSVSRVDPHTFGVQATTRLPTKGEGAVQGDSLVVGKGAIWAINPNSSVSRLDPQTGKVVATVDTSVMEIAAGPNGVVWGLKAPPDSAVVRIDPRTNAVTATINVPSRELVDLAVGGGAVWASDPEAGVVWRIDPGPPVSQRTVPVAAGVDSLAYGSGSVWAVNPFVGTISRIDPSTNLVSKTITIGGTPRDVAVRDGSAWVSDAGASCGKPLYEGGGDPQYLVVSDLALRTPGAENLAMTKAIELVFRKRGFRAGKYRVAYQSCDDSSSQIGIFDVPKCAANAKSYAAGGSVIGVIGTYNSGCAQSEIPFLNQAPGGPLAMISPANSYVGLTRRDPFAPRGALKTLYPSGVRNYARVYPLDDAEGAAAAIFVKSLGARRVYALSDGEGYGELLARSFRVTAGRIGLEAAGSAGWDQRAQSYSALVARIERARVDAVFLGGLLLGNTGELVKELRAELGPRVRLVAPDGFLPISDIFRAVGPIARNLYVTVLGATDDKRLTPRGRQFVKEFLASEGAMEFNAFAIYAAQAAEVMLNAIARSDGTRASVTKELMATQVRNGILGSFRFDPNGDTTNQNVTILRPQRAGGARKLIGVEGSTVVRVIDVPQDLLP